MDPRVIAEKKAHALAKIESSLDELTSRFGFSTTAAHDLRRVYSDPGLTDLKRVEGIAELVDSLTVLLMTKWIEEDREDRGPGTGKIKSDGRPGVPPDDRRPGKPTEDRGRTALPRPLSSVPSSSGKRK
jgi:hypothetical protein